MSHPTVDNGFPYLHDCKMLRLMLSLTRFRLDGCALTIWVTTQARLVKHHPIRADVPPKNRVKDDFFRVLTDQANIYLAAAAFTWRFGWVPSRKPNLKQKKSTLALGCGIRLHYETKCGWGEKNVRHRVKRSNTNNRSLNMYIERQFEWQEQGYMTQFWHWVTTAGFPASSPFWW